MIGISAFDIIFNRLLRIPYLARSGNKNSIAVNTTIVGHLRFYSGFFRASANVPRIHWCQSADD